MVTRSRSNSHFRPASFFSNTAAELTPTRHQSHSTAGSSSSQLPMSTQRSLLTSYSPGMVLEDLMNSDGSPSTEDFNEYSFEDNYRSSDTSGNGRSHLTNTPSPTMHHSTPIQSSSGYSVTNRSNISNYETFNDTESSNIGTLVEMLQHQQVVLDKLMDGQKALEEQQTTLRESVTALEDKVNGFSNQVDSLNTSSSGSEGGKRKRIVTRSLSNKVYTIHRSLENQFNEEQSYVSDHNKSVKKLIMNEMKTQSENSFSDSELKLGIRRCYENLRRAYLEQQVGHEELCKDQSKRRKYRSRRERKFQRRSSVVSEGEMTKYWTHLDLNYVTEESDDPDNPNGIVEHKLPWRSEKLDKFMEILDTRLEKKQIQCKFQGIVAKKVRKAGRPSESSPPLDAPVWAVKSVTTDVGIGVPETHDDDN